MRISKGRGNPTSCLFPCTFLNLLCLTMFFFFSIEQLLLLNHQLAVSNKFFYKAPPNPSQECIFQPESESSKSGRPGPVAGNGPLGTPGERDCSWELREKNLRKYPPQNLGLGAIKVYIGKLSWDSQKEKFSVCALLMPFKAYSQSGLWNMFFLIVKPSVAIKFLGLMVP